MSKSKKIGWQKYEDLVETQLSSPVFQQIVKGVTNNLQTSSYEEGEESSEYYAQDENSDEELLAGLLFPVPVTDDLANELTLMSSFDCWIGHTNFNITPAVKKTLDEVNGVEVLKICSRYRFFIGIGKMFSFKNVREEIENSIGDEHEVDDK
jgi:hypothetical protein|tara:strand:+ start:398 stop:853 length:456 start_codon:yes stop_codon:yes gene_type:complete